MARDWRFGCGFGVGLGRDETVRGWDVGCGCVAVEGGGRLNGRESEETRLGTRGYSNGRGGMGSMDETLRLCPRKLVVFLRSRRSMAFGCIVFPREVVGREEEFDVCRCRCSGRVVDWLRISEIHAVSGCKSVDGKFVTESSRAEIMSRVGEGSASAIGRSSKSWGNTRKLVMR